MKRFRQSALLDLVSREAISSQDTLRQRLRARGFDATQATISRDIKELGLLKRSLDGAYQRPGAAPAPHRPAANVHRTVAEYLRRIEQVDQLVVLKTDEGHASALAVALDRAELAEVVGTIAGEDTVLVIARSPSAARDLARLIERWARE